MLDPRRLPHTYHAEDYGEKLLIVIVPGGFEDYFREWAGAAAGVFCPRIRSHRQRRGSA